LINKIYVTKTHSGSILQLNNVHSLKMKTLQVYNGIYYA